MRTEHTARRANHTGTITRRKDGRYQGFIRIEGVRRSVYGTSEREVSKKLDALRTQAIVFGGLPNPGTRMVSDLLDAWFAASASALRRQTVTSHVGVCDRHIRPAIGSIRLSRLDPYHIQRLYAELEAKGFARIPTTVHAILHRAFRLAVLWKWLPENPCDRVIRPTYAAPRKAMWTDAQLRAFFNGIGDHRHGPLWTFLISSGCRLGEALALTWDDIEGDTIRISKSMHQMKGEWVIGEPKTEAGRRTITLPASAVGALRRQRARQAEHRLRAGGSWPETNLVFATPKGAPLFRSTVCRALFVTCKRLGVPALSPHGLRHLSASLLLSHGMPVTAVSARLGHSKVSVTLDVYSHLVGGEDREAAGILGKVMGGVA